ncbi:hypothetical protein [Brevundimonas sp.]|uniref:hypothetical protein n=1 Tax=Brevundimonas sp. TaxID=1871086 RepID=UPI001D5B03D5|nr:hypothetical protein [Brevundimonas sp.]MBL0948265.1 hypothetical protein [Brevundimonas sp.]
MSAPPPPRARVALYARYSTDRQPRCRACAEQDGGVEDLDRPDHGALGAQALLEAMEAMEEMDIVIEVFDDSIFDDDGVEEAGS